MITEWFGFESTMMNTFLSIWISGTLLFLVLSSLSYWVFFIWKKNRFNPNYVADRDEIRMAIRWGFLNIVGNAVMTAPFHWLIAAGHTRVYFDMGAYPLWWTACSVLCMLAVTETLIYWIHRGLHVSPLYQWFHEPHHRYERPMSWAGLAFNPLDSFAQAIPHHICVLLFPVHIGVYLVSVTFVTIWAVSIHDRVSVVTHPWINYTGHHSIHHRDYDHNFGQFFTFWDRIGGSYRDPRIHGCDDDYHVDWSRTPTEHNPST